MNTRLQVEHPITEWTTGIDLVAEMVRIAAGEKLSFRQEGVTRRGASIECRIYAEDPRSGFLPSPGTIRALRAPAGPWVRDDSGFYEGAVVPSDYDPLISKLSVWGPDRHAALARMRRALSEYVVTGIQTNLGFHERLLEEPRFIAGDYDTGFIAENPALVGEGALAASDQTMLAAAVAVAASRAEARGTLARSASPRTDDSLSPWVTQHRARRLGHGG
jgi:acetyl-CoA carboxylase biotin carboxylase subunit